MNKTAHSPYEHLVQKPTLQKYIRSEQLGLTQSIRKNESMGLSENGTPKNMHTSLPIRPSAIQLPSHLSQKIKKFSEMPFHLWTSST